jgi:hypothetical protein
MAEIMFMNFALSLIYSRHSRTLVDGASRNECEPSYMQNCPTHKPQLPRSLSMCAEKCHQSHYRGAREKGRTFSPKLHFFSQFAATMLPLPLTHSLSRAETKSSERRQAVWEMNKMKYK